MRSALTLVQQEVYDKSRGKQLPYVESGLPSLFFAAPSKEQLPERERLLLAMADVTPDMRVEVELVAARADMPLAPLYGALIGSDAAALTPAERGRKLQEAADAFVKVRAEMRTLSSSDPEGHRAQATGRAAIVARRLRHRARHPDAGRRHRRPVAAGAEGEFHRAHRLGGDDALPGRRRFARRSALPAGDRRLREGGSTLRRGRRLRSFRRRPLPACLHAGADRHHADHARQSAGRRRRLSPHGGGGRAAPRAEARRSALAARSGDRQEQGGRRALRPGRSGRRRWPNTSRPATS